MTSSPAPGTQPELDKLLSDPTRLAIMSVLCAAEWCDFTFLRNSVSLSDSALSKQLSTLRNSKYVDQERTYHGRVPKTSVRATDEGRRRLQLHVAELQRIVDLAGRPANGLH